MRILVDDDLVEGAVFHLATRTRLVAPAELRRFHQAREGAYRQLDADARQEAFASVHLAFFRDWGLERLLESALARFPLLALHVPVIAFRKARSRGEEGSDLYVNPDAARHAVMALSPEHLAQSEALAPLLHHELQHLSDMVDPAFGYQPDLGTDGDSASQQRLARDRYRLLWDVVIDGRLTRRGLPTVGNEAGRRAEFRRAFGFLPDAEARFDEFWRDEAPRHDGLRETARDPRGLREVHEPVPGGPCPLCGFATFEWIDPARLPEASRARLAREFPRWKPTEGLCRRCAEIYETTLGADLAEMLTR